MKILVYETIQHEAGFYPISEELRHRGLEVRTFDPTEVLKFRFHLFNRVLNKFFKKIVIIFINHAFINFFLNNSYDLVIIIRGEHLLSQTLKYIKSYKTKLINWSSDDFFNSTTTLKILDKKEVIKVLKLYDCIFTPRIHLRAEYSELGAKKIELLNWYRRPKLLLMPELVPSNDYFYDISFIGAWSERREALLSSLNRPVNIWGWGWKKHSNQIFLEKNICHGYINMIDMMKIFNKTKININIFTLENRDTTNFRNYEIPAACGFQLSEWSQEITRIFIPQIEIVLFRNKEELKQKVDEYLENEKAREYITKNGYKRVAQDDCSLSSRVSYMLNNI